MAKGKYTLVPTHGRHYSGYAEAEQSLWADEPWLNHGLPVIFSELPENAEITLIYEVKGQRHEHTLTKWPERWLGQVGTVVPSGGASWD